VSHGWPSASISSLQAQGRGAASSDAPYVADVLRPDGALLASFTCPLEAVRYASLLHEPGRQTLLRRRSDMLTKAHSPITPIPALLRWLAPGAPQDQA
jgi:hypothetical protein